MHWLHEENLEPKLEVNDESCWTRKINRQVKFKISMLRLSLCDYSDAYILVSATLTVPNTAAPGAAANSRTNIMIKNCAPFTNCVREINNSQMNNVKDIDIVMPMYNLIEYSDNYSKTYGSLWHYYSNEPFLGNGAIADFPANNDNHASFKFKTKIAGKTVNYGMKNVKIRVLLRYLGNFWRTFQMPVINCGINLILSWSNRCFIMDNCVDNQEKTFAITNAKLYVPVVTSSTQDNAKLLEPLKSGFKRMINWNKYLYLEFLIYPSFKGINRLFVLAFEDTYGRTSYKRY